MCAGESNDAGSRKRKRGHAESAPSLQLSLRASQGGWHKSATSAPAGATPAPETLHLDKLKKGQQVGVMNQRTCAPDHQDQHHMSSIRCLEPDLNA